MRYFLDLAYRGTSFYGWQRQPDRMSVQEAIEEALGTILNTPVEVVGCGRTDTGVHARTYYAHFDYDGTFPKAFLRRANKFIGPDIALYRLLPVAPEAHARFDATRRAYQYHLLLRKDPFRTDMAYFYGYPDLPGLQAMQEAAALLLDYSDFFPFCKSDTDVKTMRCRLFRSEWEVRQDHHWVYHVAADRFLRGMVRLIVGMCLNVGTGKTSLEEVKEALETQRRLQRAQSAPPQGLFLTEVEYAGLQLENRPSGSGPPRS